MDDARQPRELAEWYRALEEIGHAELRADRLKFADNLDGLAEELERREMDDPWQRGGT